MDRLATLAETSRDLVKQTDLLYKLACRLIETCSRFAVRDEYTFDFLELGEKCRGLAGIGYLQED